MFKHRHVISKYFFFLFSVSLQGAANFSIRLENEHDSDCFLCLAESEDGQKISKLGATIMVNNCKLIHRLQFASSSCHGMNCRCQVTLS